MCSTEIKEKRKGGEHQMLILYQMIGLEHMHTNNIIQTEQIILMHLGLCICICAYILNNN